MFIRVNDSNGIEFLANMGLVKFVWPLKEGATLTAIDGTSITVQQDCNKINYLLSDWAMYDEQDREQFRRRHV